MADKIGSAARAYDGSPLTPGVNVDKTYIETGMQMAARLGYDSPQEQQVVEYALQRWARGEEQGSLASFRTGGIDLTSTYAILAASRVPPASAAEETPGDTPAALSISEEDGVVTVAIMPDGLSGLSVSIKREDFLAYVAEQIGDTAQAASED